MDSDFWHQRWRQNQIGFHQQEINAYLQQFWGKLPISPGTHIFVPLCGKSRDMLWLRANGFKVLGVELSPIAVQDFFNENDLSPITKRVGTFECWKTDGLSLLCGDFFDLSAEYLERVTGVYDRASLIALPPDMRVRYAEHFCNIVPNSAETLLVTMEYPNGDMQGPPFSVHEDEVKTLYSGKFHIDKFFSMDMLAENPQFAEKGVTGLLEKVYHLTSVC